MSAAEAVNTNVARSSLLTTVTGTCLLIIAADRNASRLSISRGDEESRAFLRRCGLHANQTHEQRRRGDLDGVQRMGLAIRGNRRLDAFRGRLPLVIVEAAGASEKALRPREEQVPRRRTRLRGRPCPAGRIALAVDGVISGCREPAHVEGWTRRPVRGTGLCDPRDREQQRYAECKARLHAGSIALFSRHNGHRTRCLRCHRGKCPATSLPRNQSPAPSDVAADRSGIICRVGSGGDL